MEWNAGRVSAGVRIGCILCGVGGLEWAESDVASAFVCLYIRPRFGLDIGSAGQSERLSRKLGHPVG